MLKTLALNIKHEYRWKRHMLLKVTHKSVDACLSKVKNTSKLKVVAGKISGQNVGMYRLVEGRTDGRSGDFMDLRRET